MRTTFHSWCRTTQTAPGVKAMAVGEEQLVDDPGPQELVGQTGIVATTLFVAGSIRETLPALMFDVQIAPSPAATYWPKPTGA